MYLVFYSESEIITKTSLHRPVDLNKASLTKLQQSRIHVIIRNNVNVCNLDVWLQSVLAGDKRNSSASSSLHVSLKRGEANGPFVQVEGPWLPFLGNAAGS